jgi:hypothetical protein
VSAFAAFRSPPLEADVLGGSRSIDVGRSASRNLRQAHRKVASRRASQFVEDALIAFDSREGGAGPRLVVAASATVDLSADIKAASPQLQILAQLIGWAITPRTIGASGGLLQSARKGAGLSLSVIRDPGGIALFRRFLGRHEHHVSTDVRARHPQVAESMSEGLGGRSRSPTLKLRHY